MADYPPQQPRKAGNAGRIDFLRQYLRNPKSVGSVTPSGRQLTSLIVDSLDLLPGQSVVELGPGTGVFTKALLAAGLPAEKLLLVEMNAEFATVLRAQFPGVRVACGSAADLPALVEQQGLGPVDRVLSGLPLRSMPEELRRAIALAVAHVLKPRGSLSQFTYFAIPPLSKHECLGTNLSAQRFGFALRNIPPAFVWRYTKSH